jgi:carboxyl-terminal processing protease
MRKRFSLVSVTLLVVVSLVAGTLLNPLISGDNIYEQLTKFKDVLSITEKFYVEDVDTGKLTESAIAGILGQLDPHSVYIPATQLTRVNEEFQGSFEGIGIEYQVLEDTLLVVAPIVGGPSEALGIQLGDRDNPGGCPEEAARPQGQQGHGVYRPRRHQRNAGV